MTADPFAFLDDRVHEPVRWHEADSEEQWWAMEVERRRRRLELFANLPKDIREQAIRAERHLCSIDTQHAIEQHIWIEDPHRQKQPHMKEMPFVLWPKQIEALHHIERCIDEAIDLPITKGRELGVSWLVQSILFVRMAFRTRFSARCASRVEESVDDFTPESLFGKFRFMRERMPGFIRPRLTRDKHLHIEGGKGGRLKGEGTTKGLARGKRSTVLFFDEYAHIEPQMQRRILPASESVAASRIWVSTPNGPGDHFADLVEGPKALKSMLRLTWKDDPRKTPEWAARKIDELGPELFRQEYEGAVETTLTGKIWHVRRTKTQYDDATPGFHPEWRSKLNIAVGWDFGSGASLCVALWAIRQNMADGSMRLWVDAEQSWASQLPKVISEDVHRLRRDRLPSRKWEHWGDPSGVSTESNQSSWEKNLRAGGIPMQCLPYEWHNQDENEWGIRFVQGMIDDGTLMIHEGCRYLWRVVEQWCRSGLRNRDIGEVDRHYIRPMHNELSHGGMALVYLVRGAWAAHRAMVDSAPKPPAPGNQSKILARRQSPKEILEQVRG